MTTEPALAERVRRATEHVTRAGAPGLLAVSVARGGGRDPVTALADPVEVVGGAVALLLLDAERAVDLAVIRASTQHPEALEQLSVALATVAGRRDRFTLGRTRDDGTVEPVEIADVGVADGFVTRFTLEGKRFVLVPDDDGAFSATIDGKPPKLTALASFQERTIAGDTFHADGLDYTRLFGEPRAAGLDDGRLVIEGGKNGFDALATGEPSSDVRVTAVVKAAGSGGGVVVRAIAGESSYAGLGLILEPDEGGARLLQFDGKGQAVPLAETQPLPPEPAEGYAVSLEVLRDKVTAKVGDRTLAGKLTTEVGPGRVAFVVRAGGRLDVRRVKVTTKLVAR